MTPLIQHHLYGECAVAERDFNPGQIVLDETPLLIISYDNIQQEHRRKRAYLTLSSPAKVALSFVLASEETRNALASLYTPEETKLMQSRVAYKAAKRGVKQLRQRADIFPELNKFTDSQLIGFSTLTSANAHSFDDSSVALLQFGAKVTHTCLDPNVAVSTRGKGTTVKHIAMRQIKKGDLLLGTYAMLSLMTQPERRDHLLHNKMFICQCEHCSGPDKLRGIPCSCGGTMYHTSQWACSECSVTKSDEVYASSDACRVEQELCSNPVERYNVCLETFGWRHVSTLTSAIALFEAYSNDIDQDINLDEAVSQMTTLAPLIAARHDLSSSFLVTADRLMTSSTLHHDMIPQIMNLVQELLLIVRPAIEAQRTWDIPHALEEYYDELIDTLNQLVT